MDINNISKLFGQLKKKPLITTGAVAIVAIFALAGMWFSGYLGEIGRQSAVPDNAITTGQHRILPVSLKDRAYLLMSPNSIIESLENMSQLQSSLYEKKTYKDKWMWDITMYMIELTITFREPGTDYPLAEGNSYHTSLTRKSPEEMVDDKMKILVNPTGRFVTGGPLGDAGLTGRKIIVDTYGGMGRHGGGAFSGKDPTKVDRSGAYAARWVAKHIVAAGLAERCEIQVAYAIGVAHPLSVFVETFGTGQIPDEEISRAVLDLFDLRPGAIIRDLGLRKPMYLPVAAYGHFGRDDLDLPWEKLPKLEELREAVGIRV